MDKILEISRIFESIMDIRVSIFIYLFILLGTKLESTSTSEKFKK